MVTILEVQEAAGGGLSPEDDQQRLIAEGNSYFVDEDWQGAVVCFTRANEVVPGSPSADALSRRAAVHIKIGSYEDAVADAQKSIELKPSALAYLRKGIASFELEEHETALAAFKEGSKLDPSNSSLTKWARKAQAELGESVPSMSSPLVATAEKAQQSTAGAKGASTASPAPAAATTGGQTAGDASAAAALAALPPRYRHEFYQSSSHVVVTIFAKGIKLEQLNVEFGEQALSVTIQDDGGMEPYVLSMRLFGKIKPQESKFVLLSTKVEVRLAKAEAIQWTGLEAAARSKAPVLQPINVSTDGAVKSAYPSSSKHKKDWNQVELEVKKEEKEEKLDGEAGLNQFFQQIYGDADEDTRRAMNKSFVESGGTVLSTNWKDVGVKKVDAKT